MWNKHLNNQIKIASLALSYSLKLFCTIVLYITFFATTSTKLFFSFGTFFFLPIALTEETDWFLNASVGWIAFIFLPCTQQREAAQSIINLMEWRGNKATSVIITRLKWLQHFYVIAWNTFFVPHDVNIVPLYKFFCNNFNNQPNLSFSWAIFYTRSLRRHPCGTPNLTCTMGDLKAFNFLRLSVGSSHCINVALLGLNFGISFPGHCQQLVLSNGKVPIVVVAF